MARKKRHSIDVREGFHVVVMEDMEIWDGADLALLRETLAQLVDKESRAGVGVDMTSVKYIPSGFFGMLYDYRERGIHVRLYGPKAHVQRMLWFKEFFALNDEAAQDETFDLLLRAQTSLSRAAVAASKAPWADDDSAPRDATAMASAQVETPAATAMN